MFNTDWQKFPNFQNFDHFLPIICIKGMPLLIVINTSIILMFILYLPMKRDKLPMDLPYFLFCFLYKSNVLTLWTLILPSNIDPWYSRSGRNNNLSKPENRNRGMCGTETHPNSPEKSTTSFGNIKEQFCFCSGDKKRISHRLPKKIICILTSKRNPHPPGIQTFTFL